MIEIRGVRERARIRRYALAAQGLLQARPFGSGLNGARQAIRHLGYVQIDSISVVQRAHHHVLYSRVPGFEPAMTNRLLGRREIFEYWAHAAAFLPMDEFRFSLPYKDAIRKGQIHWYKNPDTRLMRELLARIRSDGPLRSRDLETRKSGASGWWDWKPAKKAIEQLYMAGDLMVSDREGFQKTYDLTERVLPADVDTRMPDAEELAKHLLSQQLRTHAFVSLKGLTYLRRVPGLRDAARALVAEQLHSQKLEQIRLENGEVLLCEAGLFDRPVPRVKDRVLILSPFDNGVIQRERLNALFGFHYQLECYVPEAKRRYGYFCLPLLYRDQFVGRMDCKAHRQESRLEIRSLHIESRHLDQSAFLPAFTEALEQFSRFQGCESIVLAAVPESIRLIWLIIRSSILRP